jgi:hypothetical protein
MAKGFFSLKAFLALEPLSVSPLIARTHLREWTRHAFSSAAERMTYNSSWSWSTSFWWGSSGSGGVSKRSLSTFLGTVCGEVKRHMRANWPTNEHRFRLTTRVYHFEIHSRLGLAGSSECSTICGQRAFPLAMADFHYCLGCVRSRTSCKRKICYEMQTRHDSWPQLTFKVFFDAAWLCTLQTLILGSAIASAVNSDSRVRIAHQLNNIVLAGDFAAKLVCM